MNPILENQRQAAEEALSNILSYVDLIQGSKGGEPYADVRTDRALKIGIPAIASLLADRESAAAYAGGMSVNGAIEKATAVSNLDDAGVAWVPTDRVLTAAKKAAENLKPKV